MVAVIAAVRGEIEGDRKSLLPRREVATVESIGFLGSGEARILPDRPRTPGIHRRAHAAREGREARQAGIDPLHVLGRVQRLDVDPFGRVPGEILALNLLVGKRLPVVSGRHGGSP